MPFAPGDALTMSASPPMRIATASVNVEPARTVLKRVEAALPFRDIVPAGACVSSVIEPVSESVFEASSE